MTTKAAPRILTRNDILDAQDRRVELVEVPEWGGSVWVRSLTGIERDQLEADSVTYKRNRQGVPEIDAMNLGNLRARLCSMSIVESDALDAPNLFTPSDILVLGHKSGAALNRVWNVAQRLSGLSTSDVEELYGELGKGRSDGSGSA